MSKGTIVSFFSSYSLATIPLPPEPLKYLLAAVYAVVGHLIVALGKKAVDKAMEKKAKNQQQKSEK